MGWKRQVGVLVGGLLVLGGCWPAPGQGPGRQAYNPFETGFDASSVAAFTELWTATTDETGPRGVSHPILSDGGGVHVSTTHSVYAFEATTGALRWVKTPDPALYEVDTELFFFGSFDNSITVSLRRTATNWEAAQFDVENGSWFTGELNGRMESLRTDGGFPAPLLSQFVATPTGGIEQRGYLYFGGVNAPLTETPDYSSRLTLGADRFFHAGVGVGTAPRNGVRAISTASGSTTPLWATAIDGDTATSPVLSGDGATVFVGTDASTIHAIDTATGAIRWSAGVEFPVTAPPALAGGVLYVPTQGGLVALAESDGSWLWNTGSGHVTVQPAVAAGVVFTGEADGTVRAFAADGCGETSCPFPLWSTSTGSPITGAPAVSLGKLYVGTQDGRLVAYGLPSS